MGDRTNVTLTLLREHFDEAKKYFHWTPDDESESWEDEIALFTWSEVNYGCLPFLDQFEQAGIPFNSEWGYGSQYGPGMDCLRFTPEGVAVRKESQDEDLNPNLTSLLKLIDQPEALRQFILDYKDRMTVLPWENQADYRKIYLARKLIEPPTKP